MEEVEEGGKKGGGGGGRREERDSGGRRQKPHTIEARTAAGTARGSRPHEPTSGIGSE